MAVSDAALSRQTRLARKGRTPNDLPGATIMRRLRSTCAGLMAVVLLAACSAGPLPPRSDDAIVYVIHRGWHTDIGLPVEEITFPLKTLETPFHGVRFLTFGFGERQFLIDRKPGVGAMLLALLPSRSAVLLTALRAPPEQAFGSFNVVTLHVTRADLSRMQAALWREFETDAASQPVMLAQGPYPGSVYYAAADTYDAFNTCNTWTARTLQAAGFPMPAGVLFAAQVMSRSRRIAAEQRRSVAD